MSNVATQQGLYEIRDSNVAQLLIRDSLHPALLAFTGEPKTFSDVAEDCDISLKLLDYHVKKWLKNGILHLHHEQRRAGRAVKYYQISSPRFVIPYAFTGVTSPKDFLALAQKTYEEVFEKNLIPDVMYDHLGYEIVYHNRRIDTNIVQRIAGEWHHDVRYPEPYSLNFMDYHGFVLTREEALAFKKELDDLIARYVALTSRDKPEVYFLHLKMVRVADRKI
jgi:hypothetical protein